VIVECAVYKDGCREPGKLPLDHACEAGQEEGAFTWIGLYEPTAEEFEAITEEFNLHPLAVEDALSAHQRPKLERYGDMVFLVLKTAHYDDEHESILVGEIMVFAGDGFVITVRHGDGSELGEVRKTLEADPEHLKRGEMAAVHAILDRVVDDYEPVVDGLDEDVAQVERQLFAGEGGGEDPTARIYKLGREVLTFSRVASPLITPAEVLAGGKVDVIDEELRAYFRDVHDHLYRVRQQVEGFHELLSSLLQANLAQVTVRQNNDMRRISAWVAILAVPTGVAGIYGMNFEHMPELKWQYGYPFALGLIVVFCAILYWRFRKAGWL
jgi:magnesium transporter